ncbi:protein-ADP-ribose hydrolase [Lacrimispora sp.]|uniref:protein-ADP-ribose hydrolase n=1 Tax=Lacrimispora sp. TaxID=2719234 RepID=UPI00346056CA
MEQEKRLNYLLDYLKRDYAGKSDIEIPAGYTEKRALLRALVNVRSPRPVSADFLKIQDAFLQEEASQKGIITLEDIPPCFSKNRISLWQGDITRLAVDAIVNAANSEMLGCFVPGHSCIDNAIHTAAGVQLRERCHEIMQEQGHLEKTSDAKITEGFNLPAKYVIHTVGPIAKGSPTKAQEKELGRCYISCLELAASHDIQSIAFCCISTGVFAFPKALAAEIAVNTVIDYLREYATFDRVVFNVFTDEDYLIYKRILK